MIKPHRVIGILGGMGPEATVELMRRVIALTPATDDQDHVHLIVDNNPKLPSRIAHLIEKTGPDPTSELQRMARGLEVAGAQVLAMPCNTAHAYAAAIRAAVQIPLLDMIETTAARLATLAPGGRVGILASTAVIDTHLYQNALELRGCRLQRPATQAEIMRLILDVKRGLTGVRQRQEFSDIALQLAASCDVLLVACTELSILVSSITSPVPVLDSLDVLAESIVRYANQT